MPITNLLQGLSGTSMSLLFGVLVGLAIVLGWFAFAPSREEKEAEERLDTYLDHPPDLVENEIMGRSFFQRAVAPVFRKTLRVLGKLAPKRNVDQTREMLIQAGEPMGLGVLDFFGLRLLCVAVFGVAYFMTLGRTQDLFLALRNAVIIGALGFFLPQFWLRSKVRSRQHEIERALPDALDMLTIGVEAGLGFEAAMLQVGAKWETALTQEFRRAVAEMRVGTTRDEALVRMTERCGVENLRAFVAILVQSSKLGVSIAEVLHGQAAQMRVKRRQRAEGLARQAGIKMVFPLVLLIFPALFVVILGPALPSLLGFFSSGL